MTLPGPSTQLAAPVAHETMPLLHAFGLPLQPLPAVHAAQVPLPLQTMLVPQLVPALLLASSRQVCTPVVHEVTPKTHAACGLVLQDWPGAHSVHWPLALQTMLVPQPVPAAFMAPSTHVCVPVAQEVTPLAHGLGLPVHD
jgi:hypothetical protein